MDFTHFENKNIFYDAICFFSIFFWLKAVYL